MPPDRRHQYGTLCAAEGSPMVVAGLLVLVVAAVHALWRPPDWRSGRERAVWLVVLAVPIPLLFISVVGPLVALLAVIAYAFRTTATGGRATGPRAT